MNSQTLYAVVYLEINLMASALIGLIYRRSSGLSRMVAQRNFAMTILSEIVFFLSDTAAVMITSGLLPFSAPGLIAAKEIYFFSTTLMCFWWFVYFEHLQGSPFVKNRRSIRLSSVPVWIMGVLLVVNLFTGILFYVSEDGVYHRGPLFAVQYALSYTYVFITSFRAFIGLFDESKRSRRKQLITLTLFPIAPAIAGIVQFLYPQIPLACAALSLATLLMYLNWLDDIISADPLTRLNNRKQFSFHYDQWRKGADPTPAYLLLIDADKFKSINDTWGHIQGDAALVRIADALRTACRDVPKHPNIARYGGEEVVIFVRAEDPEQITRICDRIHEALRRQDEETSSPYSLSVSVGVAKLDPSMPLRSAIATADAGLAVTSSRRNMYAENMKSRITKVEPVKSCPARHIGSAHTSATAETVAAILIAMVRLRMSRAPMPATSCIIHANT